MGRTAAMVWHASLSIIAAGLYFFFVLPRWFELTDFIPHTVGTVLRVVAAAIIALGALPVALTLLRARQPEFRTPKPALQLLVGSIVGHLVAGVLILVTAISEIWLSLDRFGPWLFGIYGAAAAVALLGIGAFYLSFVAELPPPPPKPIKPKAAAEKKERPKRRRNSGKKTTADDEADEEADVVDESGDDAEQDDDAQDDATQDEDDAEDAEATEATAADSAADVEAEAEPESLESTGDADKDAPSTEAETLVHTGGRHKLPRGTRHKLPTGKRRLSGDR